MRRHWSVDLLIGLVSSATGALLVYALTRPKPTPSEKLNGRGALP